ncbi:hypothetical protein ACOMHN_008876 [Nucella lapillus]
MGAAIVTVYLVPLFVCLAPSLAIAIRWRLDPSTNRTVAYMANTHQFNMDYRLVDNVMLYFLLIIKSVFLIVMIVCSVNTIVYLRRATRARKRMTGRKDEDGGGERITQMLSFLCVVYIVLVFPETCSIISVFCHPDYSLYSTKYRNVALVVFQFVWLASCVNSTINFFVYLVLSSRFRATLKELCFCCFKAVPKVDPKTRG